MVLRAQYKNEYHVEKPGLFGFALDLILIGSSLLYGISCGDYTAILFAIYAGMQALQNQKCELPLTAEEECKIIVGRMDLSVAPEIEPVDNDVAWYPAMKTNYEWHLYYFQKKIDANMITTDAVCVSDSVKSVENHKTIEDIK